MGPLRGLPFCQAVLGFMSGASQIQGDIVVSRNIIPFHDNAHGLSNVVCHLDNIVNEDHLFWDSQTFLGAPKKPLAAAKRPQRGVLLYPRRL